MPSKISTTLPRAFADFDVIEGADLTDKAALVGVPFGITAVRFRTGERNGVVYAEAEFVKETGETGMFSDSSTGARDQIAAYMASKGLPTGGNTEWTEMKLFVPNGLRVSEYEVKAEGVYKPAKTYYLTTIARKRG